MLAKATGLEMREGLWEWKGRCGSGSRVACVFKFFYYIFQEDIAVGVACVFLQRVEWEGEGEGLTFIYIK